MRVISAAWLMIGSVVAGCSSKPEPSGSTTRAASPVASAAPTALASVTTGGGTPGGREVVLYGPGGVGGTKAARKVGDRIADQALLKKAFGKFLTGPDQCPADAGPTEKAFREGFFVPSITSRVTGAFSAPGASEEVLGVSSGECGATHAEGFGSTRLLVRRGDQVVLNTVAKGSVAATVDVDGDGRSELLLESGGTGQGVVVVSLVLARLEGDRLTVLRDFGVVREDTCGAPSPDGDEVTSIKALGRGGQVDYELTREKRPCK